MKFNWGHGILIFIVIFLLLSTAFIVFSLKQNQDLVEDDYYDQGANYSNQIEINIRSYMYRDSIWVTTIDSAVCINACKSLAGNADTLSVYFFRPSGKKLDYKVHAAMAEKVWIPSSRLKQGRYVVKLLWRHNNETYNIEKEITIK